MYAPNHFQPNVIFFLASAKPLQPEQALAINSNAITAQEAAFSGGITSLSDIAAALAWDDEGIRRLAGDAGVITDNNNLMAMQSSRAYERTPLSYKRLKALLLEHGPLYDPGSGLHATLGEAVSYQYIGDRLARIQAPELMQGLAQTLKVLEIPDHFLMMAKAYRANGDHQRADQALMNVLRREPDNDEASYLLFAERRHALADENLNPALKTFASGLSSDARAVLESWDASTQGDLRPARDRDPLLAQAKADSPWYQRAAILRAGWRIRMMQSGDVEAHRAETLAIIDRAIAVNEDLDLYGMRVAAAYLAGDYPAVLETARRITAMVNEELDSFESRIPTDKARQLSQRLQATSISLATAREKGNIPAHRINALERQLQRLQQRLDKAA